MIIRYNSEKLTFEMMALKPIGLNSQTIMPEQGFVKIKQMDKLHFLCCQEGHMPHIYFLVCPPQSQTDDFGASN